MTTHGPLKRIAVLDNGVNKQTSVPRIACHGRKDFRGPHDPWALCHPNIDRTSMMQLQIWDGV